MYHLVTTSWEYCENLFVKSLQNNRIFGYEGELWGGAEAHKPISQTIAVVNPGIYWKGALLLKFRVPDFGEKPPTKVLEAALWAQIFQLNFLVLIPICDVIRMRIALLHCAFFVFYIWMW